MAPAPEYGQLIWPSKPPALMEYLAGEVLINPTHSKYPNSEVYSRDLPVFGHKLTVQKVVGIDLVNIQPER